MERPSAGLRNPPPESFSSAAVPVAPRSRALLAAFALLTALYAQFRLSVFPALWEVSDDAVWKLFGVAAIAAIAALWNTPIGIPARILAVRPISAAWLTALIPGLILACCAGYLQYQSTQQVEGPRIVAVWLSAVAALLTVASIHDFAKRTLALPSWRAVLPYASLFCIAFAIRVYDVENLPAFVYEDESITGLSARAFWSDTPWNWFRIWWWSYLAGMPSMELVLAGGYELLGRTLWHLRAYSAVLGSLSILFFFDLAKTLTNRRAAFFAALLVSVAHIHLHWSRNGQLYYQATALAFSVVMCMAARAWSGGGLLSWVLCGIAVGVGCQVYIAAYPIPFVFVATAAAIALLRGRAAVTFVKPTLVSVVIAVSLLAPTIADVVKTWPRLMGRPADISVFDEEKRRPLGVLYGVDEDDIVLAHAKNTLAMFNVGYDGAPNYQARSPGLDLVTAAVLPLSAAVLLTRIASPLALVCFTWGFAYLTAGAFLVAHQPSYYRTVIVVMSALLAEAAVLSTLAQTIQRGIRVPAALILAAFFAGSAFFNLRFYFTEYPKWRPLDVYLGYAKASCGDGDVQLVIDTTDLSAEFNLTLGPGKVRQLICDDTPVVFDRDPAIAAAASGATKILVFSESESGANELPGYRVVSQSSTQIHKPRPIHLRTVTLERIDG